MRTSLDLCFCLLTLCGITPVLYGVKVVVEEDSDAVLPCLISTEEDLTGEIFLLRKDGQKEVFFYDNGVDYNNGLTGQDEQFRGRVSHFQDQLKNGNASIKIQNTKVADSGNYSCIFPQSQTFYIQLVVGASPKPYVTTVDETQDWSLLQCEVQGASPEPKVEWQDSSGNILPAEEPQVSERGGRYYVTLNTTVNKTDHYSCEVTQEELYHQIHSETFVQLNENQSREVKQWRLKTIALAVLVAVLVVAVVCCISKYLQQRRNLRKMSSTTPPVMKLDNDRRASVNPADTELTRRDDSDDESTATTPPVMKLDNDRRASVNPADTALTRRSSFLPKIPHSHSGYKMLPTTEMELDDDCRASENRAGTEPTRRSDHPMKMSREHIIIKSPRKNPSSYEKEKLISDVRDPLNENEPQPSH